MRDDHVWLDMPLHKNKFSGIDISDEAGLSISYDGSIMSVERNLVESYYDKNNVEMIKAGYQKMPKDLKADTIDDLYNILSYYVTL